MNRKSIDVKTKKHSEFAFHRTNQSISLYGTHLRMAMIISSLWKSSMLALRSSLSTRLGFTMALMGKEVAVAGMLESE